MIHPKHPPKVERIKNPKSKEIKTNAVKFPIIKITMPMETKELQAKVAIVLIPVIMDKEIKDHRDRVTPIPIITIKEIKEDHIKDMQARILPTVPIITNRKAAITSQEITVQQ